MGIDDIAADKIRPTSETWGDHITKFVLFKPFMKIENNIIVFFYPKYDS